MINLLSYLKRARKEKWAIAQFNFSTFEQLIAIIRVAEKRKVPIILGTSEGESNFLGLESVVAFVNSFKKKNNLPLFLNLDHGKNLNYIKKAIDIGYDCVHFDGSELSFSENIKITKKIVKYAKKHNVLVEGEIGVIGGSSEFGEKAPKIKKELLTNPQDALDFVKETEVNTLAISIGNVHGFYREMPPLDFERLEKIRMMTKAFLVLHGGSGISDEDIKKAIKGGIVKINVNTELRIVWRETLERSLKKFPQQIKPYKILPFVIKEIQKMVEKKIKLFGTQK